MKNIYLVCIAFLLVIHTPFAQTSQTQNITAVLGAFDEEVRILQESLKDKKEQKVEGIRFVTGTLNGRKVVVAETGIGKINAALTTSLLIHTFHPREIIFTGIAGGVNPDLMPGDIVIAQSIAYHDFSTILHNREPSRQTRNPITKELNPEYFPADSVLFLKAQKASRTARFEKIALTNRAPQVIVGRIVTGDIFVSSSEKVQQLRRDFNAEATEMEGAAVAQVCWQLKVPCLVIRSLSDKADENARGDMMTFYKTAAKNSAALVTEIAGLIK
ncbi:5'-methylthioadenosine/adenosylhomocysteine nucleosidase [Xanthocytophaga flava]|uniref:5'-methylthioadenosine/adenosylhomocysteine nucleosidase n=1 Tax=Xanthocytophaga flava TaxID=3048013 RepID=UPI0028D87629|nr:5'-methylthioadenosine/adenosylhomocysteine nucleosidase [Xanthocytophaga flavus]MDJ1473599.1 5'-methylthioadenosine/adenosylhomocysteine nucleosidase [Xanthocytophaga flavus]